MNTSKKRQMPSVLYYGVLLGICAIIAALILVLLTMGGRVWHKYALYAVVGFGVIRLGLMIYIFRLAFLAYRRKYACLPFNDGINMVLPISGIGALLGAVVTTVLFALMPQDSKAVFVFPDSGSPLNAFIMWSIQVVGTAISDTIYSVIVGVIVLFFLQKKLDDTESV